MVVRDSAGLVQPLDRVIDVVMWAVRIGGLPSPVTIEDVQPRGDCVTPEHIPLVLLLLLRRIEELERVVQRNEDSMLAIVDETILVEVADEQALRVGGI